MIMSALPVRSQKMEALGTRAGGIAHDFNSMLVPIMGYGELAQQCVDEASPLRRYLDIEIEVISHSWRRCAELRYWGIWLGGVWSEAVEGTNGNGTCTADRRAVTVHQTQHFRSPHIILSCSEPHGARFQFATLGWRRINGYANLET
jgi:hypothetical protein